MTITKFIKTIIFLQNMRNRLSISYDLAKTEKHKDKIFDLDYAAWQKMQKLRENFYQNETRNIRKQFKLACKLLKVDYMHILKY